MKRVKFVRVPLALLDKLQNLVGEAKTAYMNDRAKDRWNAVVRPLDEAFEILLEMRSKLPPLDAPMVIRRVK